MHKDVAPGITFIVFSQLQLIAQNCGGLSSVFWKPTHSVLLLLLFLSWHDEKIVETIKQYKSLVLIFIIVECEKRKSQWCDCYCRDSGKSNY